LETPVKRLENPVLQGKADYITGGFSARLTYMAVTRLNTCRLIPAHRGTINRLIINALTQSRRHRHAPAISWGVSGIALGCAGVIVAYNTSHLMQGKPMNRMRHHSAKALTAASALLLLGWFSIPAGDRGSETATGAFESPQDAGVIQAGNADGAPTPPRRLHSSLSMPYFSFAQSLNPRS